MTYLKPEAISNQSYIVREILNLASQAAQQQNWLEVGNCLKQLPQTKERSKTKLFLLDAANWEIAFNIALEMLIKADFEHKWEITKIFPSLGTDIITPLSSLLLDETVDLEIRWFVCQILGNFPQSTAVLTLVKLLQQTRDEDLIAIAGKTLVKIGNSAIDALVTLYSQPEHRFLAVKSLCYIRTSATIEPLLNIVEDSDPQLRAIAIKALGSFHDRRIAPVLIRALEDNASGVRKEAAIALGFRSDLCQELNLIDRLKPLLYDINLEVCRQAAISLSRMKQKSANLALFEVLQGQTTPINLKIDIIKALGWSNTSSAIDCLEQALISQSELLSQEIITTLGRITAVDLKQQSAQVLMNFWQNQPSPSQIKQALATSLGELRCNCAQVALEQLAIDSDRKVQLHAISALKKLK